MPFGGFGGPSGRRVRSVERALTASALLPTVAFAALGAVTVLLVAQMGIAPLGEGVGSSAHDGGRAVTTPRMSVSTGPAQVRSFGTMSSRSATRVGRPPTVITMTPDAHEQADLVSMVSFVALPGSAEGLAETASPRGHGASKHGAKHTARHADRHADRHSANHADRHVAEHQAESAAKHAKADEPSKPAEATQSL